MQAANAAFTPSSLTNVPIAIPPVAAKEFACVCDEVEALVVLEDIGEAVTTGGVTGVVGRVDLSKVTTTSLNDSISKWETSFRKASVVTRTLLLSKALRDVRGAVMSRDWDAVALLLDFDGDTVLTGTAGKRVMYRSVPKFWTHLTII